LVFNLQIYTIPLNQPQFVSLFFLPVTFSPQPLSPNLHTAEGEPFLAQVFQRGPDMIDGVVDAEEAVVEVS